MSRNSNSKPVWWKNSFFIFGGLLIVIAIAGIAVGEKAIRDPGQKRESNLVLIYLGGAAILLANGWLTHQQSVKVWQENQDD